MQVSIGKIWFKRITDYLIIAISISGFVPNHAIWWRVVLFAGVVAITTIFSSLFYGNSEFAIAYFIITTVIYLAFIYTTLPEKGYRLWFIRKFGEKNGYLNYEAVLGAIFFLQGAGIGYISSSLPADMNINVAMVKGLKIAAVGCFIIGFVIKIWATKVVSVDIYYWKDMFYGRRIRDFVVSGPYKLVKNPMYGLGHLQTYATALWFFSYWGLVFALLNQLLIFSFYFIQEKKFIKRTYLADDHELEKHRMKEAY